MRAYILQRIRTCNGSVEHRGEWEKDVSIPTSAFVAFVQEHGDKQGTWAALDHMFPDGSVAEARYWDAENGFRKNEPDGYEYRPRTGGPRGCNFVGAWVNQGQAQHQWTQAMDEYRDTPTAWAVMDRRKPGGEPEIFRVWKESDASMVREPGQGRRNPRR